MQGDLLLAQFQLILISLQGVKTIQSSFLLHFLSFGLIDLELFLAFPKLLLYLLPHLPVPCHFHQILNLQVIVLRPPIRQPLASLLPLWHSVVFQFLI